MRKNAHVSWDDVAYVLAVAEHGSVAAAARALSVNHATVLRRIAAFEGRQGVRIFDKTPRGYQVRPDRRGLIEAMQVASEALSGVDRLIDAERPRLSEGLRITSTDTIANLVLPPVLQALAEETGATIDLAAANTHLDFGRMEAHITVRPSGALPDDLEGEQVGILKFGIFATSASVTPGLGLSGPLAHSKPAKWWQEACGRSEISADSFLTLAALAAEGKGRALLPIFVGRSRPELTCLKELRQSVPVWVASHVDFARSGRLVRARKFIREQLQGHSALS